jgi:hypothetical protein
MKKIELIVIGLLLIGAITFSICSAQTQTTYYCNSEGEWRYCTPSETIIAQKTVTGETLKFITDDDIRLLYASRNLTLNCYCNCTIPGTTPIPTPVPTPIYTPVYQKWFYRYSFTWPPVIQPVTSCTNDSQCVPAQCCHPTSCINSLYRPTCAGVVCTAVCSGPLDCGAGQCGCVNGKCQIIPSPIPSPTQPPGTSGVYISDLNVTYEYLKLTNSGPNPVVLTGWTVSGKAGRQLEFIQTTRPDGSKVDPMILGYSTLTLYTGREGTNTFTTYYSPLEMWNDAGDTAYLYNAAGTLVSTLTR